MNLDSINILELFERWPVHIHESISLLLLKVQEDA